MRTALVEAAPNSLRFAGRNGDKPRPYPVMMPQPLSREVSVHAVVLSEGAITPLGNNADDTWEGIKGGRRGIVEHHYPPYTTALPEIPSKIIKEVTAGSPLIQRLLERFGNTPDIQRFIFDEYLLQKPNISTDSISMNPRVSQIQAVTAGTIKGFDPMEALVNNGVLAKKDIVAQMNPYAQYGLAAAFEALKKVEARKGDRVVKLLIEREDQEGSNRGRKWTINPELVPPLYSTATVGCGFGGGDVSVEVMERLKLGKFPSFDHMMRSLLDRSASAITQAFGINGGAEGIVAACASSGKALRDALYKISIGDAELAVVVGTEGILGTPIASAMFDSMSALDRGKDPTKVSRSLHAIRRGFTIAEGAVAFVIAHPEWARRHGIKPLYEIAGYGDTSGAGDNTQPNTVAQEQAMWMARRRAELHGRVEGKLISSGHFTATPLGEPSEIMGMMNVLEDLQEITTIVGSKWWTGHMLGAAGNMSMFLAGRALQEGVVPGMTFDGEIMDEAYGWDIPTETRYEPDLTDALWTQFGFGDANFAGWLRKVA